MKLLATGALGFTIFYSSALKTQLRLDACAEGRGLFGTVLDSIAVEERNLIIT